MTRISTKLILVLALCASMPPAASASFPGANGPFVLSIENCSIFFSRYLVKLPAGGGDLTPLTEKCPFDPEEDEEPPSYALPEAGPAGERLLAVRSGHGGPNDYVSLAPDGSDLTPVPAPIPAGVHSLSKPSFAPNGKRFAFEGERYVKGYDTEPLRSVRLDGTAARVIRKTDSCGRGDSCNIFENPRWSPDGRFIAVDVIAYDRGPAPRLKTGLWLLRAKDGKPVRRLVKKLVGSMDWSPDGKRVVYATSYSHGEEAEASGGNLYVVNRDGTHRRKLVHRHKIAETQVVWSPDGKRIAWISLEFTDGDVSFDVFPKLWTIPAKGGKRKLVKKLPEPYVEEGDWLAPQLTWLAR